MRRFAACLVVALAVCWLVPTLALAQWESMGKELLKKGTSKTTSASGSTSQAGAGLSQGEIGGGLKQALEVAVQKTTGQLGKPGGFLQNPKVRIPLPGALDTVAKGLKAVGKGQLADEVVTTMNTAAEKAVPETLSVFMDAISKLTFADARAILGGGNTAATQHFDRTERGTLKTRILPIVKEATDKAGVTGAYKKMTGAAPGGGLLGSSSLDLDSYVADKALDGVFKVMADYEASIRANPAARTTDLLKKVFGN